MRDKLLSADDFERGMYVMVRGQRKPPESSDVEIGDTLVRMLTSIESQAFSNTPMRIEHVDLPQVVCSCACGRRGCKMRAAIDTRKFELVEVSREFMHALRPKRWWQFWK